MHKCFHLCILDLQSENAHAFGEVSLTPTTFLIAPDGTIALQKTGLFDIQGHGALWECPYGEKCLKYTADEVMEAFDALPLPPEVPVVAVEEVKETEYKCDGKCSTQEGK